MRDAQRRRVERRASEHNLVRVRRPRPEIPDPQWLVVAVARIDREWMAESSEVDADLMRPTRSRHAGAERVPAEPFLRLDAGLRLARALLVPFRDPHAPAASRRKRQIDAWRYAVQSGAYFDAEGY